MKISTSELVTVGTGKRWHIKSGKTTSFWDVVYPITLCELIADGVPTEPFTEIDIQDPHICARCRGKYMKGQG